MKADKSLASAGPRLALMAAFLAAAAAFFLFYDPHHPPDGGAALTRVRHVVFATQDGDILLQQQNTSLPQDWRLQVPFPPGTPDGLLEGRYQLEFDWPLGPDEPAAILIPRVAQTVDIAVNGTEIFNQSGADPGHRWQWYAPTHAPIPPELLRPGVNRLDATVHASLRSTGGLSEIILGGSEDIAAMHDRLVFLQKPLPIFANLATLVMAVPLILVWLQGRASGSSMFGEYGLLAAGLSIYALRSMHVYAGEAPLPMSIWLPLVSASLGWATGLFCIFLLRFSGLRWRTAEWAVTVFILGGTVLLFAFPDGPFMRHRTLLWYVPVALAGTVCISIFCIRAVLAPDRDRISLSLALVLLLPMTVHDLMWLRGALSFGSLLWLPVAMPAVSLAILTVAANRFARDWMTADELNRNLTERVREAQSEIRVAYEDRLKAERREATAHERAKLVEDLHDGVGSRISMLLSTLHASPLPHQQIVARIRECLDDLRMVVTARDTNSLGEALREILGLNANLLEAGGIELTLDLDPRAEALHFNPQRILNIMRIAQEAISNAARHGADAAISLSGHLADDDVLEIIIRDDGGGGHDPLAPSSGRGLTTMRTRAARMGGHLAIEPSSTGWTVRLKLPIHSPAMRTSVPAGA
jgi:two-component system, NarL family, sensor histidine kinase UhpB